MPPCGHRTESKRGRLHAAQQTHEVRSSDRARAHRPYPHAKSASHDRQLVLYVFAESVQPFPHKTNALRGTSLTFDANYETRSSEL